MVLGLLRCDWHCDRSVMATFHQNLRSKKPLRGCSIKEVRLVLGLLFKEFYSNWLSFLLIIALIPINILLSNHDGGPFTPIVFAVMVTWYITMGTSMSDYKNDTDVLVNSLPVTRQQIVTSKYVSTLLTGWLFIVIAKTLWMVFEHHSTVQFTDAAFALLAVVIFIAVYFPLYYRLGTPFIIMGLIILTISFFTVFPIVFYTGLTNRFWGLIDLWQEHALILWVIIVGITTATLFGSWTISNRLYRQKEF